MKRCITDLPMVTAPRPKEELVIYLCAAREAVSAVLLMERDSQQLPIYFVSRALQALEINYSSMEKLVLALVAGFRIVEQMRVHNLEAKVDSKLVANQINGSYVAKEQSMI
ncbi:reverse transcriptase domain-containing protein [Tanacetum coccineum]